MKLLIPIIKNYDKIFKNDTNEYIISSFNDKEAQLFGLIHSDDIQSNAKAASELYNSSPSKPAFVKMKGVFRDKLIQIITNVQFNNNDLSLRRRYVDIMRNYFASRILTFLAIRKAAIYLARKNYIKAQRYNFTYIAMDLARLLGAHYLTFEKDEKLGQKYFDEFDTLLIQYQNESYAEKLYGLLMLQLKSSRSNRELVAMSIKYSKLLESKKENSSVRFMVLYFLIKQLKSALTFDHEENIEICQSAINYLEKYSEYDINAIQIFLNFQIGSLIELSRFDDAIEKLNVSFDDDVNPRWLTKQETKVKLYFYTNRFDEAKKVINRVMSETLFKFSNDLTKIRWWLFKFYHDLYLMLTEGKELNIRRIKNNLSRLSTDKQSGNVPLMIGELIYNDYHNADYLYDRDKSIRTYIREYLSDGANNRSKSFLQLMLALPSKEYNEKKFDKIVEQNLHDLEKYPIRLTNTITTDIIPYEKLWDLVISSKSN